MAVKHLSFFTPGCHHVPVWPATNNPVGSPDAFSSVLLYKNA
jgi:hypothetical protein